MDAFKENLDDLEQQVADAAAELQQLERCTTDAVSFEVRARGAWGGAGASATLGRGAHAS